MVQRFGSQVNIRMVEEQSQALQIIAEKQFLTVSDIIRAAIAEYLQKTKNQELLKESA